MKCIKKKQTIHYPNKIRSHLVTIAQMTPYTPKSTSKLRSALHFRYSIVIPRFIPALLIIIMFLFQTNGIYNIQVFKILITITILKKEKNVKMDITILITIITMVFVTILTTTTLLIVTNYCAK